MNFPTDKIILGTAQWGLEYGVANRKGIASIIDVFEIISTALNFGINTLDTAPSYGDAERKIAQTAPEGINIITKIPRLSNCTTDRERLVLLEEAVNQSLTMFGDKVSTFLFHHADDLTSPYARILISALDEYKQRGQIKKIGVSIYTGEQIDQVIATFKPDLVQVPFNVLDQRLHRSGHLEKLHEMGVEIHARSVFLQGLLHLNSDDIPEFFSPIAWVIKEIHALAHEQGLTINQALLSFVRDHKYVDRIIVGVDSAEQVKAAVNDFAMAPGFKYCHDYDIEPRFIDPRFWDSI